MAPRRSLGQHFLLDVAVLESIVDAAAIQAADAVLEVGTGPGTLTRLLVERARRVVTVEVDDAMASFAAAELGEPANLTLLRCDALAGKSSLAPEVLAILRSEPRWAFVSNLPYAIATPLLVTLFAEVPAVARAVVTVQAEVADRLMASPGDRAYGPPTVLLGYWAEVEAVRRLPPGAFRPPPKVDSTVVRITRRPEPLGKPGEYRVFAWWVQRLFSQRRKQIGGLLRRELGPLSAREALQSLHVEGKVRPETLPASAFLTLSRRHPEPASRG